MIIKKQNVKMCNTFYSRLKGYMFNKNINKILCFPKCNSIHTFFMFKNIDVVMTDKLFNILYIYKNLKPFRIIFPKKNIYYTFELPTNTYKFTLKDKINLK